MELFHLANNFSQVVLADGTTVWFSYTTAVAVEDSEGNLTVHENNWATTTGKHLNRIDGGDKEAKARRVTSDIFKAALARAMFMAGAKA